MITTPELINALTADAAPVRRLRPPSARAAAWLTFAALLLAALSVVYGLRPDLAERLRQPVFVVGNVAAMLTGILAAIATFMLLLPDRSRRWLILPAPSLVIWLSTVGYGCLTNWVSIGPEGVRFGETVRCFATLVLTSVPLLLAMLVMLRHVAVLRPMAAITTGSIAIAAITATALSLFHDLDATVMILIWNLGTSVSIIALGCSLGSKVFSSVARRPTLDRV